MIRTRILIPAFALVAALFLTGSSAEARPIVVRQGPIVAPIVRPVPLVGAPIGRPVVAPFAIPAVRPAIINGHRVSVGRPIR